ncbi:MAG: hypothetical protein KAI66_09800 [Lentisphaeria bacterium]|nr:hypothetical protein [Lentisphaeria bacterium]
MKTFTCRAAGAAWIIVGTLQTWAAPGEQVAKKGGLSSVLLLFLCASAGLLAIQVLLTVLRPVAIRKGCDRLRVAPTRSLLFGSAVALALLGLVAVLSKMSEALGGGVAIVVVAVFVYVLLLGLTALSQLLGEAVLASMQSARQDCGVHAVVTGGGLLLLCGLVPIVGQVVHAAALLAALGVGSYLLYSRPKAKAASPTAPDTEKGGGATCT